MGYDFTWRADRDTRIATLPFGYADGYPRSLAHKGQVTLHGKRVPIVGIICMDQCMIDLSQVPEARLGDEVVIYGDGADGTLSIQEIAQLTGTNKNDIVSRLTRRPPRVYVRGGQVIAVQDGAGRLQRCTPGTSMGSAAGYPDPSAFQERAYDDKEDEHVDL